MSTNTHSPSIHRKPIAPRGPSLETWLSRQFLLPPATAAVIAEHAGFRLRDDRHVGVAETTSSLNQVKEARHV